MNGLVKLIAFVLAGFIFLSMLGSCSGGSDSNEFDWNDEEDVSNFLKWKESTGTGWSDN